MDQNRPPGFEQDVTSLVLLDYLHESGEEPGWLLIRKEELWWCKRSVGVVEKAVLSETYLVISTVCIGS